MSIYLWFLLLGALSYSLAGPRPTSMEEREELRGQRARRKAAAAACRAVRQADRLRIFGSHPVLYGALAWASPVVLPGLLAWLMEP